jgi:hypothetical protein
MTPTPPPSRDCQCKFPVIVRNGTKPWCKICHHPVSRARMHQINQAGKPAATVLPGRNEPCPCKSGRKYKHCCMAGAPLVTDAAPAHNPIKF